MHSQKHSRHAAQLPGRHHHVLQAAGVRVRLQRLRRRRPLAGVHGLLAPGPLLHVGFQLLLGLLAAQPSAGLAAPIVAHRPPHAPPLPPPHATDSHVAPRLSAQQLPAAPRRIGTPQPEMRLSGGLRGGGQGGQGGRPGSSVAKLICSGRVGWGSHSCFSKLKMSSFALQETLFLSVFITRHPSRGRTRKNFRVSEKHVSSSSSSMQTSPGPNRALVEDRSHEIFFFFPLSSYRLQK